MSNDDTNNNVDSTQPLENVRLETGQADASPASGDRTACCAADVPIDATEIAAGKTLAILSYIFILCIIPLIQKDNEFSLFHAKQALLLLIAGAVLPIVNVIPCLGQIVYGVASLALFVFWILGLVNAIKGRARPLPFIGKFAIDWFKGIAKVAK